MRISDWSSDVCSSDLMRSGHSRETLCATRRPPMADDTAWYSSSPCSAVPRGGLIDPPHETDTGRECRTQRDTARQKRAESRIRPRMRHQLRSEEHTSELQSLMRISYAVCCLKKKKRRRDEI